MRVVVLISGRGSNMAALLRNQGPYQVVGVISNRPAAGGLKVARDAGIATTVVDHQTFELRPDFDQQLANTISKYQPDLIVLAGFMRILGKELVKQFTGQMVNIHPSLLPAFRGLKTHERALKAGVSTHGASVHFVNSELDGGPVIAQATLAIDASDTPQTLADRLLPLEHQLLSEVVKGYSQGKISYDGGKTYFDGTPLAQPLQLGADGTLADNGPAGAAHGTGAGKR